MNRLNLGLALVAVLGACATSPRSTSTLPEGTNMLAIDPAQNPNLRFRIDSFFVPESAREEFQAAARRNQAFIEKQPGYLGHTVFEKTAGPGAFNVVTVAVWESQEALDRAGVEVRAYYQRIGFDMPALLARWGARAELGNFKAPPELQ